MREKMVTLEINRVYPNGQMELTFRENPMPTAEELVEESGA